MTIYFSLEKGMTNEDFLGQLRGKVSGEGRGQVATFMRDDVSEEQRHMGNIPELANITKHFEVLDMDTEKQIALVSKTKIHKDQFDQYLIYYDYYLVGTNDEGSYFVHPVNGFLNPWLMRDNSPQMLKPEVTGIQNIAPVIHGGPASMSTIMAWANRHDMGFRDGDRIQGDLLIKLFEEEETAVFGGLYVKNIGGVYYDQQFTPNLDDIKQGRHTWTRPRGIGNTDKTKHVNLFNNHRLSTDGNIYQVRFTDLKLSASFRHRQTLATLITGGQALVLEHDEHKTYSAHMPNGWMALILRQRGEILEEGMEAMAD